REMESQLATLIASCESVVATWQSQVEGEPNLLSPFLERLDAVHRLAYGHSLREPADAARFAAAAVRPAVDPAPEVPPTRPPAPAIASALLPRRISASGYNSLLACPYQYYARYALGLAEPDEVQEQIEKRDYGTRLHEVLTAFHRDHPRVTALDPEEARQALVELSERAFAPDIARDYFARAWLAEWQALIPDYLDWQRRREEAGWRFSA